MIGTAVLAATMVAAGMSPAPARAGPASAISGFPAPRTLVVSPAYYRPVLLHGKAFPLARSNFVSLIQIMADWHAPRLRLVNGQWLLVGVHEGIDISAERGTPVV